MDPSALSRGETDYSSTGGAPIVPQQKERKKRHGVTGGGGIGGSGSSGAAAIMARRLGGSALPPGAGGNSSGKDKGATASEEPFISSSRDASEEDNDDASGYSDSASSLRMPQPLHSSRSGGDADAVAGGEGHRLSSLEEILPTSARDRAVVDSKQAHTRRLSPTPGNPGAITSAVPPSQSSAATATTSPLMTNAAVAAPAPILADKTPSSSSPPRHTGAFESMAAARRPSATVARGDAVRDTLVKASAALSSSSSADLLPGESAGSPAAGAANVAAAPSSRPVLSRTESMSSADSDEPHGPMAAAAASRKQPQQQSHHFHHHHHHHPHRHHHQSPPLGAAAAPAFPVKDGSSKLDLGSLPVQSSVAATALPTPRAQQDGMSSLSAGVLGKDSALNKRRQLQPSLDSTSTFEETEGEEDADATEDGAPYDGDVEFAARRSQQQQQQQPQQMPSSSLASASSSGGYYASPASAAAYGSSNNSSTPADAPSKAFTGASTNTAEPLPDEQQVTLPPASTIRNFVHKAIYEPVDPATGQAKRDYKINVPPDGGKNPARPVRIYADGVYDLFHYAHSLQLRQAKLSFPSVHLVVGVVSSRLCAQHKNKPVMSSAERYTAVRNCRWVDEVVEDAPWVINQELLDLYKIDYVAHDEEPYGGKDGAQDIYRFVKDQGRFLPTNRTPGVSTSELLARIVEQYREHAYDGKLSKIGHAELAFK